MYSMLFKGACHGKHYEIEKNRHSETALWRGFKGVLLHRGNFRRVPRTAAVGNYVEGPKSYTNLVASINSADTSSFPVAISLAVEQ